MELEKRVEIASGLMVVGLIAAGCLLVLAPFGSSILWAALICFTTWPLHERVMRVCNGRRTLAAAIMTTIIVIVTVLPFAIAASAINTDISDIFEHIKRLGDNALPPPPAWLDQIPFAGKYLHNYWVDLASDTAKSHDFFEHLQVWLLDRAKDFGIGLLHLGISVCVAFFFYRDGEKVVDRVSELAKRALGDYSLRLVTIVGNTVRGVVYGFLGTAVAQGVLAAIGFSIVRVPGALLLGLLSFFLALVPFGCPLVWLPVTGWLLATGRIHMAIFMGLWGLFVISGIDHVLRPYLTSREAKLPFILVFLGALGGILAFGFIGIFLGPTLLAVGFSLLHEFIHNPSSAAPASVPTQQNDGANP